MYCDDKSAIEIAHKSILNDRTRRIKLDTYFIKEKIDSGLTCTPYVGNLPDILTKRLRNPRFQMILSKLGMEKLPMHQLEREFCKSYEPTSNAGNK